VKIIGVELSNSRVSGVVLNDVGFGGAAISQLAAPLRAITDPIFAVLAPDLVIFKSTDPPALQATFLPVLYNNLRAGSPSNDWIFNLVHQMQPGTNAEQNDVIREFGLSVGQSVHDDRTWSGTYAQANARGWMRDGIHRNDLGNSIGVRLMFSQSPLAPPVVP